MKKILTFLILSTFYFSAKANSISSDSTVCPIISNLEIYVDGITAEVYIRNFAVKKSNYDVQYKVDSVNNEVVNDTSKVFIMKTPGTNCFRGPSGLNKFSGVSKIAFITLSPNPSNAEPNVVFQLSSAANVTIKVFDALGSNILNNNLGNLDASEHSQTLSGADNLPTGFYFVTVQANNETPLMTRWIKL